MTERDKLITELFENMNAFKRAMHGRVSSFSNESPLSHAQLELLFTLRYIQPVSSKQLAEKLHMTPGGISQLVESIESHGYLERKASEQDKRVQFLYVSDKGEKLLRSHEKSRRQLVESVISDLTDEELAMWVRIQQKMTQHFKSEPKE